MRKKEDSWFNGSVRNSRPAIERRDGNERKYRRRKSERGGSKIAKNK